MPDFSKTGNPYTCTGSSVVYDNGWIKVVEDRVIRPDGGDGVFGVICMKAGSTVLPVTAEGDVYLAREFKYGLGQVVAGAVSGELTKARARLMRRSESCGRSWD